MRRLFLQLLMVFCGALAAVGGEPDSQFDHLVAQLGAETYAEREEATQLLRAAGERARSALRKAAAHEDAEVRERAGRLLRELIWKLSSGHAARLGEFAGEFAGYLDAGEGKRLELLSGLQARTPREAESYILQAAADTEGGRGKAYIASLLGIYRSDAAETAVLSLSRDEDRHCRDRAAAAMGKSDSQKTLERLVGLTADGDAVVRAVAFASLGRRGEKDPAVVTAVRKGLQDQDPQVRSAACAAARGAGSGDLANNLWPLAVGDADVNVRCAAIASFGGLAVYDNRESAGRLAALLDDRLPAVRMSALAALVGMRAGCQSARLAGLLSDDDGEIAAAAASGLATLGARQEIPLLRKALHAGRDTSLTCSVAQALAALRDDESFPAIVKLLRGESAPEANSAAVALAGTGNIRWGKELALAEKRRADENFPVLSLNLRLCTLRDRSALGPLCAAITDGGLTHQLTNVLADLALFDQAAAMLARDAAQDRRHSSLLAAQGAYETQGGSEENGLALMLEAVDMDRNDAMALNNTAWFLLTCCDRSRRDIPAATRLAERAARLEPRSACILDTLAWALHLGGKEREALSVITDAVRWIDPADPRGNGVVAAHCARILASLGRKKEALQAVEQAVTRWPRDPELAVELVRAYCDMGMHEAALGEAKRMIELLYPDTHVLLNDPDLEPLRTHLREAFARLLESAEDSRREMLGLLKPAIDAALAAPARNHPMMFMEIPGE